MRHRIVPALMVLSGLAAAAPSFASGTDDDGIPVKVVVEDQDGKPIPSAVVRNPKEADRHAVNAVDGSWQGAIFYMADGSEVKFAKGMELEFEISAPGYVTADVKYVVRARKNLVEVKLQPMKIDDDTDSDDGDDPGIQFGRSHPIDGQ